MIYSQYIHTYCIECEWSIYNLDVSRLTSVCVYRYCEQIVRVNRL